MDTLSSSFLPKLHPKYIFSPIPLSPFPTSPHPQPNSLNISSVRIEDKPQTTSSRRAAPQPLKKQTPPPPPTPQQSNTRKRSSTLKARPTEPLSLPTTIFNVVDGFINTFIDPPLRPSVDPRYVLSDNFAPVDELPPTQCQVVEGSLPTCLNGAYIRNGPNPQFLPRGPYHLFDGDGMLHSIRISDGKATLCSRYVKTYKYTVENKNGFSVVPNVFSGFNGLTASAARGALAAARIVAGQFNPVNGFGLANTSLALIGGKLYALGESDLPYAVKVAENGDIFTEGRNDFDGTFDHLPLFGNSKKFN